MEIKTNIPTCEMIQRVFLLKPSGMKTKYLKSKDLMNKTKTNLLYTSVCRGLSCLSLQIEYPSLLKIFNKMKIPHSNEFKRSKMKILTI